MTPALASFDVFDTLLTRSTGSPESTFLALGQRLQRNGLIACSAAAFANWRAGAEHRAFDNAGGLDSRVSLREIYAELALGIDIDPDELMQQELLFEREHLCVIPQGLHRLNQARCDGLEIAFVSDMYLGHSELSELLDHDGLRRAGDRLLVSSDHCRSKRSGRLFQVLLVNASVQAARVVHHGNDEHSDIKMARRLGLAASPFLQGNLNRYEQILDRSAVDTDGLSGLMAGAARLSRLSIDGTTTHERTIIDTAASVAAPIVIGFVLWALRRASEHGVKQLFFIARDGQLLLSVAEVLARKIGCQIELKYIHGSRRAWQLAALDPSLESSIDAMLPGNNKLVPVSISELLDRFDLKPDEIRIELDQVGIDRTQWTTNLSAKQLEAVSNLLKSNPNVRTLLAGRSERARETLLDYFRQHGLTQDDSAIVDLGTGGTLFNALSDLLTRIDAPIPRAYYLGQRKSPPNLSHWRVPDVYLFDSNHNRGFYTQDGLIGYLEAVCSANHGTTTGYQYDGDEIVPVLSAGTTEAISEWGHPLVHEAVVKVAGHLAIPLQRNAIWQADIRDVSMRCFERFWNEPTNNEAYAWGSFPFDDGQGEHTRQLTLACPYGLKDVLTRGTPHRHWWHGGALALSGSTTRLAFRLREIALKVHHRANKARQLPVLPEHSPPRVKVSTTPVEHSHGPDGEEFPRTASPLTATDASSLTEPKAETPARTNAHSTTPG